MNKYIHHMFAFSILYVNSCSCLNENLASDCINEQKIEAIILENVRKNESIVVRKRNLQDKEGWFISKQKYKGSCNIPMKIVDLGQMNNNQFRYIKNLLVNFCDVSSSSSTKEMPLLIDIPDKYIKIQVSSKFYDYDANNDLLLRIFDEMWCYIEDI